MICTQICKDLYERLSFQDFNGSIHSVFRNSFNVLDQESNLITFLNGKKPMAANSIGIDMYIPFDQLDIEPKQNIYFSREYFLIKNMNIKFTCRAPQLWDKEASLNYCRDNKENISDKLKLMEKTIREVKKDGIYPLINNTLFNNPEILSNKNEFIKDRFVRFMESYIDEDMDNLPYRARDIIGYGVGLTPSMDDFISGIMISRIYLSSYLNLNILDAYKLNSKILEKIKGRTTLVSEEMLKYASRGISNEYVRGMMISFLGKAPIDAFKKDMEKVISIGETSGSDLFLGIYIGTCIMLNKDRV